MKKLSFLLLALAGFALTAPAASVILTFNDIADVTLTNGLGLRHLDVPGGIGLTTGWLQSNSGVPIIRTNDLSVPLVNYVSGQAGSTQHWSVAALNYGTAGYARRTQNRNTSPLSVGGSPIWFSFLASLLTTNGETALTFNGNWGNNGSPAQNSGGLRIGLGHYYTNSLRGALGVGPLTIASTADCTLSTIVNGVNGAVTAGNFVPTDGTAGLVLGRIDYDPLSSNPRISLWYNPDVPNEASLPAATLTFVDSSWAIVPMTITNVGCSVARSHLTSLPQNEIIDNIKVSNEPTGFDIVYKNAALPTPILTAVGTQMIGSESGPTNIVITINADKPVAAPLTIYYTVTGVATNGHDGAGGFVDADYTDANFSFGTSYTTIPAGQSSVTVTLAVIDDALPEGNESVNFALQNSIDYIIQTGTLAGSILENNDANVSLQYMFTRTPQPQIWDTNLMAAPANLAGIGNGSYSGAYFVSLDAACSAAGDTTASNAVDAVANGDFMGLTISPVPGRAMTLTNLTFQAKYANHLYQVPSATGAVVFVRSSLDNFAANLAEFLIEADTYSGNLNWYTNSVPLSAPFSQVSGQVEFRLYVYDDSPHNQVCVRIDNLYFNGSTQPLAAGVQQVSLATNVVHAAEPGTAGQFTLVRYGDTTGPLTVNYTVAGTASNGVDYVMLPGAATFNAGQSTLVIPVTPIDDDLVEPDETVLLTLTAGAYGLIPPVSVGLNLVADADVGGLVAWFFNENNNTAASLGAVAAAGIRPSAVNQLDALNASAGAGLGNFGGFGGGNLHGFATLLPRSAPSSMYIGNAALGTNAATALTNNDYVSFSVGPEPGYALSLSNFTAWVKLMPDAGQTNWAFLRSSIDNFATDLGSFTIPGVSNNTGTFLEWTAPLSVTSYPGAIEFRVYVYSSRSGPSEVFRMDDVTIQGSAVAAPPGSQVVTVIASDASATESGSDPGAFTFTRSGSTANPLTLTYSISGTASNGVDYALLPGTLSFAVGQATVQVPVTPINDNRPEMTETVSVTIVPGAEFYLGLAAAATVSLVDDGDTTPLFALVNTDTNAYERVAELLGAFTLNRSALGETTSVQTLSFTLGGSAVPGVDYISSATNSVTFDPGVLSRVIQITPINNTLVDGNRTVSLSIASAPGYILDAPAESIVTIVDDDVPVETLLWSDNFDAGTSAANYTVRAASDLGINDYEADFAFDYSTIGLPPAPGASTTIGLKVNANLLNVAAGVNFYPNDQNFSGDFALRFNLYVSMDPAAGADNEAAYFGIDQTGLVTNWLHAAGTVYTTYGEGVWATFATRDSIPGVFTILAATNAGGAPIFVANTGNGVYFPQLFNSPPYAMAGRPNNAYDSTNKTWADCELSQVAGLVSLKVNNNTVLQYTNPSPAASGNIFIGYGDPFATLGSINCYAVYDNVRVVRMAAAAVQPLITGISVNGAAVEVSFSAGSADTAGMFKLFTSGDVAGTYGEDHSATITATGPGLFKATTATSGPARYYRIRR